MDPAEPRFVGRLTRGGELFGFLVVDEQYWTCSRGPMFRKRRWTEKRTRYRLDLLSTWDEGFLSADDEADLAAGRFLYRGEVLECRELHGVERDTVLAKYFSGWD